MVAERLIDGDWDMASDVIDLDQLQASYKAAVEEWIAAIKHEEVLASVNHNVAELDKWEAAHFAEDAIRNKVKAAKKQYENALREKFFGF
jgi:energy-converting hydrogenase A subunit M